MPDQVQASSSIKMDKSDGDDSNQSSPKSKQLKQQQQTQPQQHKRRIKVSSSSNPPEIDGIDSELVPNSLGLVEQTGKSSDDAAVVIKKRVNTCCFYFVTQTTHTHRLNRKGFSITTT